MSRIASLLGIAAGLAGATSAAGQHPTWVFDVRDGSLHIENRTEGAVRFDGYTISCEAGCLDPAGWRSISDAVIADTATVLTTLGAGALGFGKANPSPAALTELTIGAGATLQPGATWSFGFPIQETTEGGYDWCSPSAPSGSVISAEMNTVGVGISSPDFVCVPEPSSGVLLALIGGGLLGRHRRRLRG